VLIIQAYHFAGVIHTKAWIQFPGFGVNDNAALGVGVKRRPDLAGYPSKALLPFGTSSFVVNEYRKTGT
jgi:hypothetical protein